MSKQTKKSHAVPIVIVLTILLAALSVGCFYYADYVDKQKADRLEAVRAEKLKEKEEADQAYAVAMAEYEAETRTDTNPAWPTQKSEGWDVIDLSTYPLENQRTVSASRAELMNRGMLLVNQWHSRPDDFDESALIGVGKQYNWEIQVDSGKVQLFPIASDALRDALAAAKEEGLEYYMVSEGYRSWDTQNGYFQAQVSKLSGKYSGDELIERAKEGVNYPGTSEFNTGLSFTLRVYSKENAELNKASFASTDQGIWMYENSWKYGLIFRFPQGGWPTADTEDKHFITGISSKLNLYRYVGKGNATMMHVTGLCLEEYVEYLMEHPHVALFEDGKLKYEIYRQIVGEEPYFDLILTGRATGYDASLDNMGGVITVFSFD